MQPALGAVFSEASRKGGAAPVVVIGNAAWHRYFGGDPSIVGKQIRMLRVSDASYTVSAVLPASFREIDAGDDRDFWFPEDCWQQLGRLDELGRCAAIAGSTWSRGSLQGASIESAQAELKSLGERMAAGNSKTNQGRGFRTVSDRSYRLEQAGNSGLGMLAIVMLVVIISAVNVANLLLSRANVRGPKRWLYASSPLRAKIARALGAATDGREPAARRSRIGFGSTARLVADRVDSVADGDAAGLRWHCGLPVQRPRSWLQISR